MKAFHTGLFDDNQARSNAFIFSIPPHALIQDCWLPNYPSCIGGSNFCGMLNCVFLKKDYLYQWTYQRHIQLHDWANH